MRASPPGSAGLIPARAGNTRRDTLKLSDLGAHPRSRGEHMFHCLCILLLWGSSPLARGTLLALIQAHVEVGLIPARAGNTKLRESRLWRQRAHPRSRGEHPPKDWQPRRIRGSSPLARGTRIRGFQSALRQGLIPARAGNTGAIFATNRGGRAHPRSRGEHQNRLNLLVVDEGSSPLARGTHLLTWGFTPYISKIESLWSQSLHPEYTINSSP